MTPLLALAAFVQAAPVQIPLWKDGAPGFESRRNEPEQAKDYWVKNIHNPSITVFLPPRGTANGTAVVVVRAAATASSCTARRASNRPST